MSDPRQRRRAPERPRGPATPPRFQEASVVDLEIASVAAGGRGLARREGFVFLVAGGLPGDLVRVRVTRRRPRHAEGDVLEVLRPSRHRVDPPCAHAGVCGGCALMAMAPRAQADAKRHLVVEGLERIGKLRPAPVERTVPSPVALGYRNRLDFAFGIRGRQLVIGLHERACPAAVFPVERCHLAPAEVSKLARRACTRLAGGGHGVWRHGARPGLLRQLVVRRSRDGGLLANLITGPGSWPDAARFACDLMAEFPRLEGVVRSTTSRVSLTTRGREVLLAGRDFLLERLDGLTFEVGANAFFQVNAEAAELLFREVGRALAPGPDDTVLELYCGSGALSLFLARRGASVLGVEADHGSVARAERNARRNGLSRVRFLEGDSGRALGSLLAGGFRADQVVVNPPRSGLDEAVVRGLVALRARRIAYVSCNPATLGRDLGSLHAEGYGIRLVRPFDLFPQTPHVEALALLVRGS